MMPKDVFKCAWCGKEVIRWRSNSQGKLIENHFCDYQCKGAWQRKQREDLGFTEEWLYEQYVVRGRDCNEIAKEIGRDGKCVWKWIHDYGIETRKRGYGGPNQHRFKKGNVPWMAGKHHTPETRERLRQISIADGRVPYLVNGEHWTKQEGAHTHWWKGGISPERQAFYGTDKWKNAEKRVRERDNNTCQLCGEKQPDDAKRRFDVHHINKFDENEKTRADPDNLVVLCRKCHMFVHSSKNTEHKFMAVPMTLPEWLKGDKDERIS